MNKLEQAARQALEVLEDIFGKGKVDVGAITALREALTEQSYDKAHGISSYHLQEAEQAEQEPIHVENVYKRGEKYFAWIGEDYVQIYTHPVRTKDLTDDELREIHHLDQFGLFCDYDDFEQIARAVIAADREKNK